jgi:hypothetical protein
METKNDVIQGEGLLGKNGRHETQHNDIQHEDTQHKLKSA